MSRRLEPCPSSPNCVFSGASDAKHQIAPLVLSSGTEEAWQQARRAVAALPRTRIVEETADYLHAETTSAVLRFVDDLELALDAERREIGVRSASRVGWSDFGANRKRVEALRAALVATGAVAG